MFSACKWLPHLPAPPLSLHLLCVTASAMAIHLHAGHQCYSSIRTYYSTALLIATFDPNCLRILQDFDSVLNISFSLMLGVYGTVAALGYYYFGSSAHTLLTTDLAQNSPFTGHYFLLPGLTADKLVSLSIMLNAYSTYPSLVLVMQVSHTGHALAFLHLCKACLLPEQE